MPVRVFLFRLTEPAPRSDQNLKQELDQLVEGGVGERVGGRAQAGREHQHLQQRLGWSPQG